MSDAATIVKERPILFSNEMVRAVLEGRKTVTRRTRGLKMINEAPDDVRFVGMEWYPDGSYRATFEHGDDVGSIKCPYGGPGDRLWVREAYRIELRGLFLIDYKVDPGSPQLRVVPEEQVGHAMFLATSGNKYRPSIHMPRWACRTELEIIDVRAERLQNISGAEAKWEGILIPVGWHRNEGAEEQYRSRFRNLWDTLNADRGYGWEDNPWVWRVEFKRID